MILRDTVMTRSIDQQNQEPGTAEPSKDAKPNNGQKEKSTNPTTLKDFV